MIDLKNDVKLWEELEDNIREQNSYIDGLLKSLHKTIVGQEVLLERMLIGLFGNGHLLLEGFPGLAKTLAVKTLAMKIHAQFSRIQFTPDILPADILGTMIYNIHTNEFNVKYGPIFSNFVLADEINRAPEKVQSALLEVMQEHQVTIGNNSYSLSSPFMVLATQNPIDQSGTYELPEAQMDRFMMKLMITYPTLEEERLIMQYNSNNENLCENSFSIEKVKFIQSLIKQIYIDEKLENYILNIVFCTRFPENYGLSKLKPLLRFGASPRGTINLAIASRGYAFLQKRTFVIPDDVKAVVFDVLRHRIGLSFIAMAENLTTDNILQEIVSVIPIP